MILERAGIRIQTQTKRERSRLLCLADEKESDIRLRPISGKKSFGRTDTRRNNKVDTGLAVRRDANPRTLMVLPYETFDSPSISINPLYCLTWC